MRDFLTFHEGHVPYKLKSLYDRHLPERSGLTTAPLPLKDQDVVITN